MYTRRISKIQGLTITELMVALVIAATLAIIGAFAYSNYIIKARIAEVFVYAESVQKNIETYYANYETWPSSAAVATYDRVTPDNQYISQITYYPCSVANAHSFGVDLRSSVTGVAGNSIVFTAKVTNGRIRWYCRQAGSPAILQKYLPPQCDSNADVPGFCNSVVSPSISDP